MHFFNKTLIRLSFALTIGFLGCRSNPDLEKLASKEEKSVAKQTPKPIAKTSITGGGDPFPPATPTAVVAVTEKIFPAVVRIDVAQEVFREGKRSLTRGIGSGVIIDDVGHILTNYHVAGRAAEIYVTLFNKERVPGKLVGDDHWTDLAVVQIDADALKKRNIAFKYAALGDSSTLVPGQDVIAVGTPFGLARTMTLGIVSNNERTFYPERQRIDEYETGDFSNWIQMDTPIAPGNSGGPLVDMRGQVVGINTRGVSGQALNFAIPIDTAKPVIGEILRTATAESNGHVERSDLGVEFRPLQDLESFYGLDINKGALIDNVQRGSAAATAGVKSQDILLSINGKPTNIRFPEELANVRRSIASLPVGTEVTLEIKRGKETLELKATTERLTGEVGEESELKVWGMSVRDVTRTYANAARLENDKGVVVTTKSGGYPADKADLDPGDIIVAVNNQKVDDIDVVKKLYEASVKVKETSILLDVVRSRGHRSVILKITY